MRTPPGPNAPTSERSFDASRTQTVTSRREPIYADYTLPELQDLRRIPRRPAAQQADDLSRVKQDYHPPAAAAAPEYDYEPIYGQLGAGYMSGGVFGWQPGMDFGTQTAPVALGYRRVPRR